MIRLDLHGSFGAGFTAGAEHLDIEARRGGVVCTAARAMLALGVPSDTAIEVCRDGVLALTPDRTVGWWAARTVVEDGEAGPRIRLLSPTDARWSGNSRCQHMLVPGTLPTALSGPSVGECS